MGLTRPKELVPPPRGLHPYNVFLQSRTLPVGTLMEKEKEAVPALVLVSGILFPMRHLPNGHVQGVEVTR